MLVQSSLPDTKRLPRRSVIDELLGETRARIERSPRDTVRRTLERKLESLQFVVDCWPAVPPSHEQLSAMMDILLALREAAAH